MKIYFCGSIRGGRDYVSVYQEMVTKLKQYGTVLTEHVADASITEKGNDGTSESIYRRDTDWLKECDVVIAECSQPSIGVGYEIAYVEALGKPINVFYGKDDNRLSAMISGDPLFKTYYYRSLTEALSMLDSICEQEHND